MHNHKRLNAIASLVPKNVNVIDIGCDHALLDIYLTIYNDNHCIASDINKNVYEIAKENIIKAGLENRIPVILSNGFENINLKENVTAVICGMGTSTILNILKTGKLKYIDSIIVQSNNDLRKLRKEIVSLGYFIDDEIITEERGIFYCLIRFCKGKRSYKPFEYFIGPIIKTKKDNLTKNYIKSIIFTNKNILKKLPKKYFYRRIKLKYLNHKLNYELQK